MTTARDVNAYLAAVPEEARAALAKLRRTIRDAVPTAEESISYRIPAFKYQGEPLAYYAAFSRHCSLFPASAAVISAHEEDLKSYGTSKGTIRFPASEPLPAALVRKLVRARVAEIDAKEAARKSSRRRA